MMYYVYIVECRDGSLYTGWTVNLPARLGEHNRGKGAKYTRSRLPVTLVYYEVCETKEQARKREYAIKQLTRQEKQLLLEKDRQRRDGIMPEDKKNTGNNLEIELKLRFSSPDIKDKLCNDVLLADLIFPGTRQTKYLENVYYDTATSALKRAGLAYRVRRQDQELVATVKADGQAGGGLHRRAEWSVIVKDIAPDISPFSDTPVGHRLQSAVQGEPLQELFKTCFWRESMDLKLEGEGCLELAIDQGEIRADNKTDLIQEVELELKEGHVARLLHLAALLVERYPLLPEMQSKYHRGLKLAGLATEEDNEIGEQPSLNSKEYTGDVFSAGNVFKNTDAFSKALAYYIQDVLAKLEVFLREPAQDAAIECLGNSLSCLYAVLSCGQRLVTPGKYQKLSSALKCIPEMLKTVKEDNKGKLREMITQEKLIPALLHSWAWSLEIEPGTGKSSK